jgi:hypothetical protein
MSRHQKERKVDFVRYRMNVESPQKEMELLSTAGDKLAGTVGIAEQNEDPLSTYLLQ